MCSYCMVREAKKPSFVRLDRRSNEELKTQTKYLCDVSRQMFLRTCTFIVSAAKNLIFIESYVCSAIHAYT